ncbi:MAG: type II toxin-antitoxin system VapC family toxin [Opitutales bacterium]|jgi:predicted nucleic acid-binding protein
MLLLDTSFLVEYEAEVAGRQRGDARRFIDAHRSQPFAISMVSLGEFAEGFADLRQVEAFLARFRVINLSRLVAYRMAAMQSALPQRLGENDAWIAATALYYSAGLVGRERAFARVPGLKYTEF